MLPRTIYKVHGPYVYGRVLDFTKYAFSLVDLGKVNQGY